MHDIQKVRTTLGMPFPEERGAKDSAAFNPACPVAEKVIKQRFAEELFDVLTELEAWTSLTGRPDSKQWRRAEALLRLIHDKIDSVHEEYLDDN
jgi:hypothetical protein